MLDYFNKSYIRWILYIIALLYLGNLRTSFNKDYTFISSDGQIKYFQTLQIANGEFSKTECLYPGFELDPDYKYYLFDYPWAFFGVNGLKCAFQYSPYFPMIASLVYRFAGEDFVTLVPILFWFLAILLFDATLKSLNVRGWISVLVSLTLFLGGFLSLSALDYAELSMNDYLSLLGVWGLVKFLITKLRASNINVDTSYVKTPNDKWSANHLIHLGLGILGFSGSILLRPEGIIPIGLFLLLIVIFFGKDLFPIVFQPRTFLWMIIPGFVSILVFLTINKIYSGNSLGFRASNTSNDMKELYEFSNIWNGFVADLWKSDFKSGLFFALPQIFIFVPLLLLFTWKLPVFDSNRSLDRKLGYPLLFSGIIACLVIPILSPYRAGYHHFGNRYFEIAVIFVFLGIAILWNSILDRRESAGPDLPKIINYSALILFLVYIITSYFSFKYTKEGWKVFKDSSKLYSAMQEKLDVLGQVPGTDQRIPILHKSLFTGYLVGVSFLDRAQYRVNSNEQMTDMENIFLNAGINKYMSIEFLGQPRYMSDIPKDQYDEKINIKYESPRDRFMEDYSEDFLEFRLSVRLKK